MRLSWGLVAVCISCMLCGVELRNGEDIDVSYADSYYNDISEDDPSEAVTPTAAPCATRDLSRWDKLFIMLEDSHMRQNMLLQHVDDMVRVKLRSLRDEMRRLSADNSGACANALEGTCAGLGEQVSRGFERSQRQLREAEEKCQTQHNATRHLLQDVQRAQATCLAKLESRHGHRGTLGQVPMKTLPTHPKEQDATSADGTKMERTLLAIASDLQRVQAQLVVFQRSFASRYIPSGCEMAMFFPMRSQQAFATVRPNTPMSLRSFTVCLWAKVTESLNKTVLFSYGTRQNPQELQLFLSGRSVHFTVGGESQLVGAQSEADSGQWWHCCGAWSSSQGLASLWVNGQQVARSSGVAEEHVLPGDGTVVLGQERGGPGLEREIDPMLAFTGKMTGVNAWDRVLPAERISQGARPDGSCDGRGNVIGWGVSEMTLHGSVQYIN
ncbi:pentraxin-related protein PTX3 [Alosa sapidissima]|uniref:pentraxin-related protein PTX3 n=1 Tax=Alosa sapidissima TaxID=34773 RepID=UPI001C081E8C|nr:pentraxin-related protein PTX3 [Alosa sapidissima]